MEAGRISSGNMVQGLYEQQRLDEIAGYCRCDVLDTYFVFLRTRVLLGQLSIDAEQRIVTETKQSIEAWAENCTGLQRYLERWGDWPNPWGEGPSTGS